MTRYGAASAHSWPAGRLLDVSIQAPSGHGPDLTCRRGSRARARARSPTLTFLFTDIEAHSEKWEAHPAEMSEALREHDEIVAAAVTGADGRVVKNEGDGAMAVFGDAAGAVEAAVSIQRTLAP